LQLIVKFALTYDFRKVKMHRDGFTFNRAPNFIVYAHNFRLCNKNINTLHKNTEALLETLTKVSTRSCLANRRYGVVTYRNLVRRLDV
jgi:hypothetical protein